jgi:type IV pilus assembly protein PilW
MKRTRQQGYTMVELLIALGLALFLSTLGIHTFVYAKKNYTTIYHLNQLQNKMHLAMIWLSRDIRMAGLIGCVPLARISKINDSLTFQKRLIVWHNDRPSVPFSKLPLADTASRSDKILIQAMDPKVYPVIFARDHHVRLFDRPPFQKGDTLLISDCQQAELFYWGQAHLQHTYTRESEVAYLNKIVYYVAKTERYNRQGKPIYALYRRDLNQSFYRPSELLAGVRQLTVRLGVSDRVTGHFKFISPGSLTLNHLLRCLEITLSHQDTNQQTTSWQWVVALREPYTL